MEALPRVIELMGRELGWSKARKAAEHKDASAFLETMYFPKVSDKTAEEVVAQVMARGASAKLVRKMSTLPLPPPGKA